MSEPDDSFLARWSRLKRTKTEAPGTLAQSPPEPDAPAETAPALGEQRPPNVVPEAAETESLPRIEDLTPASDISAFLRDTVPEALRTAALRRMWSLDPAIRDYVGPAEYAWDFNTPGSMAGFGPGTATPGDLPWPSGSESSPPEAARARDSISADAETSATASEGSDATESDMGEQETALPEPSVRADTSEESHAPEPVAPSARRRHGGALPG